MRDLSYEEMDMVSGGGPFGVAAGALGVAGAALRVLAFVAAAPITIPLTVATGVTVGFAGVLAMVDAGVVDGGGSVLANGHPVSDK